MNTSTEQFNEDEELAKMKEKRENYESNNALVSKINSSVAEYYDNTIANNAEKMQSLTNQLFNAEVEVKETQIEGRKQVLKNKVEKEVTQAKSELDAEKHERSKTILKAQGLTEKLPSIFRATALAIGYPFFVLYLLTLGWVIEFVTFVVKGFITMIYDCADRFVTLNKKFQEDEKNKNFSLGKSIFNILKWVLILGAAITIIVLLVKK